MALHRKNVSTGTEQQKETAQAETAVTKINVTEVDSATSVARKSFTGMIDQKKKIAASLSEGKDLAQLKDIRFVKPF